MTPLGMWPVDGWLPMPLTRHSVLVLEPSSKFLTLWLFFPIRKGFGNVPLENIWSDGYRAFGFPSLDISGLDVQVLRKQSDHQLKSL